MTIGTFFTKLGGDIKTLYQEWSSMEQDQKRALITSVALRVIGAILLPCAVVGLVASLAAFACGSLAGIGFTLLTALIVVIAQDLLIAGCKTAAQRRFTSEGTDLLRFVC